MNYSEHPERERVLDQALKARTLSEIASATLDMDHWVDDHPDDLGIMDAYEVLTNMQEIAEHQRQEKLSRQPRTKVAA